MAFQCLCSHHGLNPSLCYPCMAIIDAYYISGTYSVIYFGTWTLYIWSALCNQNDGHLGFTFVLWRIWPQTWIINPSKSVHMTIGNYFPHAFEFIFQRSRGSLAAGISGWISSYFTKLNFPEIARKRSRYPYLYLPKWDESFTNPLTGWNLVSKIQSWPW